jgi:signal transduction histidine kinase
VDIFERLRAGERIDHFETIRITKSGKHVPVSLTISPVADADGRFIGAANIYRDITEQKRAHETLSSVNRRLIEAQEQERSRIARELHDDIAQRLAVLAFEVDDLTASSTAAFRDKTIALKGRVSEIASDVQGLSHELHSPRLRLLGLAGAMRAFCEQAARQHAATVDFEAHDVPNRVPPEVSLCLFRVLQEAVHNAAKHSGVQRVQARLWGAPGQIHLMISDEGSGFDVEMAKAGPGIGLISMAERMKLVDGDLVIESQPQHGTTIRVRVPVSAEPRIGASMSETVERDSAESH